MKNENQNKTHSSTHREDNRSLSTHNPQLVDPESGSDWFTEAVSEGTLSGDTGKAGRVPPERKKIFVISDEIAEHYSAITPRRDEMLAQPGDYKDSDIISMLNATTKMLQALVSTKERLYNAETYATFQQVVIETIAKVDKTLAEEIVDRLDAEFEETK
jgi:hypothetical protein